MTDVVSISQVLGGTIAVGTMVTVRGWVRTRRDSKAGLSFVNLNDGSCFDGLQIVVVNTLEGYEQSVLSLSAGCAFEVEGELVTSQGKGQSVELRATRVVPHSTIADPERYPLAKRGDGKHFTPEFLREIAHLRPRTNTFGAVTRLRHAMAMAVHRFFHEEGFYWVNTPIVTTSDAEGAGQMFRVSTLDAMNPARSPDGSVDFSKDFFGKPAHLTVSGQLNVEPFCLALSKVYTFGPTFRAENSNTARHLAEFWMIEPEVAFADLRANADLAERFLKYIFRAILSERMDDLRFFDQECKKGDSPYVQKGVEIISRLEQFVASPFERVDYREAVKILQGAKKKFEFPVSFGVDLQTEHERYLTEQVFNRPVVVMNYPKAIKAFYMRQNDDNETVAAMDVLAPGIGEIIGGSQREERLDVLTARMDALSLPHHEYEWYLDTRRYGSVPHAGFGLGFERLVVYAAGLANIRDAIPYPRVPGSARF
ncbi:MAG: asparagine--tRNA ligase [Deltaproteobacteria bacterium]|nr:asparagine--tRNA ligase [Deltaproteobacteria bacterium]